MKELYLQLFLTRLLKIFNFKTENFIVQIIVIKENNLTVKFPRLNSFFFFFAIKRMLIYLCIYQMKIYLF